MTLQWMTTRCIMKNPKHSSEKFALVNYHVTNIVTKQEFINFKRPARDKTWPKVWFLLILLSFIHPSSFSARWAQTQAPSGESVSRIFSCLWRHRINGRRRDSLKTGLTHNPSAPILMVCGCPVDALWMCGCCLQVPISALVFQHTRAIPYKEVHKTSP